MNDVFCEQTIVHEDIVNKLKNNMLDDNRVIDLSELFKVFGDSTRIKIISSLLQSELCVCDIAAIINSSVSAVSHQLRILKQAKLVKFKKVGKVVYYSLDDEHVSQIFNKGCEHLDEI